ncbi:hypothetical protein BaRGS_00016088 [Batillaria attramentaria]|uniref:Secreted protein n=1 Tax=Batillaria attramentaria TaxID=370345 RepID=A0ABD0L0M2_9CAEN
MKARSRALAVKLATIAVCVPWVCLAAPDSYLQIKARRFRISALVKILQDLVSRCEKVLKNKPEKTKSERYAIWASAVDND